MNKRPYGCLERLINRAQKVLFQGQLKHYAVSFVGDLVTCIFLEEHNTLNRSFYGYHLVLMMDDLS